MSLDAEDAEDAEDGTGSQSPGFRWKTKGKPSHPLVQQISMSEGKDRESMSGDLDEI